MPKHILIDARYLDGTYTGIATYSQYLVEALARIDQENRYSVIVRPGFRQDLQVGENFEVLSYKAKPISGNSYFSFHKLIEELKPDILHSLAPHLPVFYRGPSLVTVHDLQPFIDPEFSARRAKIIQMAYGVFYRWAYPTALAKARWIICDSYATRDDVVRLLPGTLSKLIVVHPGLEPDTSEPPTPGQIEAIKLKVRVKGPYFLFYGSTRPNKNLPNLVKAFGRLLRQSQNLPENLTLVLVLRKDRFFRDIQKAIVSRKLHDRVLVLDPLSIEEKQALLAGALSFVFPSKYEGFGFPPLEAMRAGVPVLAGRSGALPEILGDAAVMVDPDDIEDIARGLRKLVDDEQLRQRLIPLGRHQTELFQWENSAKVIRDIYQLLY